MKILPFLLLLVPSPLFAAPCLFPVPPDDIHLVQTGCDTISTPASGVAYDFKVENESPGFICTVRLYPMDAAEAGADTCHVLGCDAPAGWTCIKNGPTEITWVTEDENAVLEPGATLEALRLALDRFKCCYVVYYFHCGIFEAERCETVCAECDEAVQLWQGTWGRTKALYR